MGPARAHVHALSKVLRHTQKPIFYLLLIFDSMYAVNNKNKTNKQTQKNWFWKLKEQRVDAVEAPRKTNIFPIRWDGQGSGGMNLIVNCWNPYIRPLYTSVQIIFVI